MLDIIDLKCASEQNPDAVSIREHNRFRGCPPNRPTPVWVYMCVMPLFILNSKERVLMDKGYTRTKNTKYHRTYEKDRQDGV